MIKFDKKSWFLYSIICFLFIFNFALFYRIPLLLPISGLIALCIIPGYLLRLLFRIKVTDIYRNFLYSIGISIAFDLFFGLIINTLMPIFGDNNPLSSQTLQIWFSIIILLLTLLIIYTHNAPIFSFKIPKLLKIEKIFLIFGFLILLCIHIGIYFVNSNTTNLVLIFSISLIPILIFCLIVIHNKSIKRIYPFIIYLISFSLLMLLTLRSNYILGIDTNEEYYFFYNTLINSIWIPDPTFLLSAAVGTSLLPTVFENFLKIGPQILFKLLFPLLFSITPLIIYIIIKRYIDEMLALLGTCFYIFNYCFVFTTALSRTSLAIFFIAFAVFTILDKELSNAKKFALLCLFICGTIFSHYTSSLIFFLMICLVYLMDLLLSRYKNRRENRIINLPLIIFFISMIFFWYGLIINRVFIDGLRFTLDRLNIFNDLLKNDVDKYITPPVYYPFILKVFTFYSRYFLFILIGFGILFAFYSWILKERNSLPKFSVDIDKNLLFFGIIAFGLLCVLTFAPYLFFGYSADRTQQLIFVVLSVFLIIGACNFFNLILWQENLHFSNMKFHKKIQPLINYCKTNQNKIVSGILLLLLIPQLFWATGITHQFFGISIISNSPKFSKNVDYGIVYIFDQEAIALQWFKDNSDKNVQIFSDDYGTKKITSLINQKSTLYQKSLVKFNEDNILKGYVFVTVTNEYYNSFFDYRGKETQISSFDYIFNQKNKIYSNGAVLYK